MLMKSGEIDAIIIYGAMGFQEMASRMDQNKKVADHLKFPEEMAGNFEAMGKMLIAPAIKASQKYSVPIIYINPNSYSNEWSKDIRENGGIVFQFWDQPVNCLAKICSYAEYRRKKNYKKIV
jgi:hypothetical protein